MADHSSKAERNSKGSSGMSFLAPYTNAMRLGQGYSSLRSSITANTLLIAVLASTHTLKRSVSKTPFSSNLPGRIASAVAASPLDAPVSLPFPTLRSSHLRIPHSTRIAVPNPSPQMRQPQSPWHEKYRAHRRLETSPPVQTISPSPRRRYTQLKSHHHTRTSSRSSPTLRAWLTMSPT